MYVIDPTKCSHPARIRGKDGRMKCLVCGGEVKPPRKPTKADKAEDKKPEETAD